MKQYPKVDENVFRAKGIEVELRYQPNMNKEDKDKVIDKALKKFKRKVKDSGIMLEIYERSEFKKKSAIKREEKIKSRMRAQAINRINNK